MSVTRNSNREAVRRAVDLLTSRRVLVGVPMGRTQRQPDPPDPATMGNADLAYIHEYGSPAANIPARPFLRPGIREAQVTIRGWMMKTAQAAFRGDEAAVTRGLHATGMAAKIAVQGKIQRGPFMPLAASTLAKRRKKGRTGTLPLLDTGQLRNAINYVIRTVRTRRY